MCQLPYINVHRMMEDYSHLSPLYKIRKVLKFLRFFVAFPLSVKDDGYTEFIFRPHVEWAKLIVMLSTIVIVFSPSVMVFTKVRRNQTEVEEINKFFNYSGLSSFDIFVGMSFIPINTVSMICHFMSFRNACANLSNVCRTMDETKNDIARLNIIAQNGDNTKQSRLEHENGLMNMMKIYICNVISSVCQIYVSYTIFFSGRMFGDWLSTKEKVLVIVSYVVYLIRFGYPLISATSEYIITIILYDITNSFEDWSSIINGIVDNSGIKTSYQDMNER